MPPVTKLPARPLRPAGPAGRFKVRCRGAALLDIDESMVIRAVGEKAVREHGRGWSAGPVMAPWLEGDCLWARVSLGSRWGQVGVCAEGGALEVSCRCRQRAQYCSHSVDVMVYAAANIGYLKAARAAEDEGIREAARIAMPWQRGRLAAAASSGDPRDRNRLHLMELPPSGLPPRGLDYGRVLDLMYMEKSAGCYLKGVAGVDFDEAAGIAKRFAASGDAAEAARIYAAVAETIAKNAGIVDDSYAHYSESLQAALGYLVACMSDPVGRPGSGVPDAARRAHISWMVRRVAYNDPDFPTDLFSSALDSACTSAEDAAWRRSQERLHG